MKRAAKSVERDRFSSGFTGDSRVETRGFIIGSFSNEFGREIIIFSRIPRPRAVRSALHECIHLGESERGVGVRFGVAVLARYNTPRRTFHRETFVVCIPVARTQRAENNGRLNRKSGAPERAPARARFEV